MWSSGEWDEYVLGCLIMLVCVTIAAVAALVTRGLNPLITLDHVLRQPIELDVL